MEEEKKFYIFSEEDIENMCKKAAEVGAETAMKKLETERVKVINEVMDKRLRNTKLLLRNYQMLKENAENSIYGRTQMEESAADILDSMMSLYDEEVIVDSIKRSASRTAVIVAHIETMLSLYKVYCDKSNDPNDFRRWEVINDFYLEEHRLNAKAIAKKQNMSKRTVYEDINNAVEKISALIFGVDGLRLH